MDPHFQDPPITILKPLHIRLKIDLRATNQLTKHPARLYQLAPKPILRGYTNWVSKIGKTDLTF